MLLTSMILPNQDVGAGKEANSQGKEVEDMKKGKTKEVDAKTLILIGVGAEAPMRILTLHLQSKQL